MNRQPIRAREVLARWARQRAWRLDYRDGGLDRMLIALCIAIPIVALLIHRCGGPG